MVLTRGMAGNNDGQILVRTCQSIKKKSHIVSNRVASCNNYALCRSVRVTNLFVYDVRCLCYTYQADGANHGNNEHEIDDDSDDVVADADYNNEDDLCKQW